MDTDDLGNPDGNVRLDYAGQARDVVMSWHPTAVGKRPIDWAGRDLQQVSLRTDPRCVNYHALLKFKPTWLCDEGDFDLQERRALLNARIIHYLHCERIYPLSSNPDPFVQRRASAVVYCRPTQAMFEIPRCPPRDQPKSCRAREICPFCIERAAREVFEVIPAPSALSNHYLLCTLLCGPFGSDDLDDGDCSRPKRLVNRELNLVRKHMRASGGVFVYTFLPSLAPNRIWQNDELQFSQQRGLLLRGAILAEIDAEEDACQDRWNSYLDEFRYRQSRSRNELTIVDKYLLPVTEREARRRLVFGSQSNFPEFVTFSGDTISRGLTGAFMYAPWIAASNAQIAACLRYSFRRRIFDLWGTWRTKANRKPKAISKVDREHKQRVRNKRRSRLKPLNDQRQQRSKLRIDEFIAVHRLVLAELMPRNPGRVQFRREFESRGVAVPDRVVRGVIDQLRKRATTSTAQLPQIPF